MNWLNTDIEQLNNNLVASGYNKVANSDFATLEEGIADTTPVGLLPASGVGFRWCITSIMVTNSSSTVATKVRFLEDASALVSGEASINGGGFVLNYGLSALILSEGTAFNVSCATTGSNINVSINAYKVAV